MPAFVANTNMLTLVGLTSAADGAYVNDAAVAVTVKDKGGNEVPGASWPISMPYVSGSNGDYRGIIPHTLLLDPGNSYVAEVSVDAGEERVGFWTYTFRANVRVD